MRYISPNSIANLIRMKNRKYGVFLLVEGDADARLFKKFLNNEICSVEPVHGKDNVIQTANLLRGFNWVACITDGDFDFLMPRKNLPKFFYRTDTHDIETLIMKSLAFEDVLSEFANIEKLDAFESKVGKSVRGKIIESASIIGRLRWLSLKYNLSLSFKSLDFTQFVNYDDLSININEFILHTIEITNRNDLDARVLRRQLRALMEEEFDPWQISCGHDAVEIMSIGIEHIFGYFSQTQRNKIEPDRLESALRLAYTHEYFESTELFASLKKFQDEYLDLKFLKD